jgi:diaminopimelate epimerase
MHGCGNDFVVLDQRAKPLLWSAAQIRQLADRHVGVGCDQVLLIEPPTVSGALARYRVFNPDGSHSEQCGNGARCIAAFLGSEFPDLRVFTLQSDGGLVDVEIFAKNDVEVRLSAAKLGCTTNGELLQSLTVDNSTWAYVFVDMGNPHVVIEVADVAAVELEKIGPLIEHHANFPARTNVAFVQIHGPDHASVRVWERGAGITLACGSGACASLAAMHAVGRLGPEATLQLPGGALQLRLLDQPSGIALRGPATFVFSGDIQL